MRSKPGNTKQGNVKEYDQIKSKVEWELIDLLNTPANQRDSRWTRKKELNDLFGDMIQLVEDLKSNKQYETNSTMTQCSN